MATQVEDVRTLEAIRADIADAAARGDAQALLRFTQEAQEQPIRAQVAHLLDLQAALADLEAQRPAARQAAANARTAALEAHDAIRAAERHAAKLGNLADKQAGIHRKLGQDIGALQREIEAAQAALLANAHAQTLPVVHMALRPRPQSGGEIDMPKPQNDQMTAGKAA